MPGRSAADSLLVNARLQRRAMVAKASTPSIRAKESPMHIFAPPPKGK